MKRLVSYFRRYGVPGGQRVGRVFRRVFSYHWGKNLWSALWSAPRSFRVWLVMMLLTLTYASGMTHGIQRWIKADLQAQGHHYLESSIHRAEGIFLGLSAARVGLAVLKSIEVGVAFGGSFDVRVGEIVHVITRVIDWAWRSLLVSLLLLFSLEMILTVSPAIAVVLLNTFFLVWCLAGFCAWALPRWLSAQMLLQRLVRLLFVVAMFFYLVYPFLIYGMSVVERHLTGPVVHESSQHIRKVTDHFKSDPNQKVKDYHSWSRRTLDQQKHQVPDHVRHLTHHVRRLIIGYLFEIVLVPFGIFGLLHAFLKIILPKIHPKKPLPVFWVNKEPLTKRQAPRADPESKFEPGSPGPKNFPPPPLRLGS